jgi:hypothetical protein
MTKAVKTDEVKTRPGVTIRARVVNDMIAEHTEEFHARMAAAYSDAGLTYVRPLSADERKARKERKEFEKARAEYEALVAKFPGLADRSAPAVAMPVDDEVDDDPASPVLGIDPALSRS